MKYSLKDKHVLITGAATGIGRELARSFAAEGAHCVLHGLPGQRSLLKGLANELEEEHAIKTWALFYDFCKRNGPEALYRKAASLVPRIEVLVNNAGVMAYGKFWETRPERSDDIVMVNVRAYMALLRLAIPDMIAAGGGRILNIGSVSAFQPTPYHAVYGASKAFIQALSDALRQELKGTGVTLSVLSPSYTDTPLLHGKDFPKKLLWYTFSGLSSPEKIGRAGVMALKRGKPLCIPGLRNYFIHMVLPRITPRRLVGFISGLVLRGKKG